MIDQGGVSFVDKDKVQDVNLIINNEYKNATLKVGKRKFLKLV